MIDVTNDCNNLSFDVELVYKAIRITLKAHNLDNCEVSVLLTDDSRIKELNREYRGIDSPTDVLAFAMHDDQDSKNLNPNVLGDVVISLETAERQAKAAHHSIDREVVVLTIHGILHLIGFDHKTNKEANVMFEKQDYLLKSICHD
ncbi:rRNA maturation RNase YbeY [Candidatus Poribacteria bacterium]|nr:MAG: rRNA maturation RNase YbeY [Candidatus Poribacteria bacterium]